MSDSAFEQTPSPVELSARSDAGRLVVFSLRNSSHAAIGVPGNTYSDVLRLTLTTANATIVKTRDRRAIEEPHHRALRWYVRRLGPGQSIDLLEVISTRAKNRYTLRWGPTSTEELRPGRFRFTARFDSSYADVKAEDEEPNANTLKAKIAPVEWTVDLRP
jgi:hypothetical protein